ESEGAKRGHYQHRGGEEPWWHFHDGTEEVNNEQAYDQQEDSLHYVGKDDGIDHVGMVAEEPRTSGDIVHREGGEQHGGTSAAGYAEREEGDHGATLGGGVGGFGG